MKIVCSFHPSSSVLGSVKCRLGSGDLELEHLVVAKLDRLEVFSLQIHGLQKECTLPVFGKICSVKAVPISPEDTQSKIAVMLTHPEPEILLLQYTESEGEQPASLTVDKQIPLFERLPRVADFFTDFLVHPSGELIVASCYASKLKVITLNEGKYESEFDVALPETNLLSLAFLPIADPCLAILYLDTQGRLQLCARDVNVDKLELSTHPSVLLKPTHISETVVPFPTDVRLHLIPVSFPSAASLSSNNNNDSDDEAEEEGGGNSKDEDEVPGGIVVAGGRQILFYELATKAVQKLQQGKIKRAEKRNNAPEKAFKKRKPMYLVEWPWDEVAAWSGIDGGSVAADPSKILISDKYGRLALLSLDNLKEAGIILVPLGEISSPQSLTYLDNSIIYVGSHLGDSQLVQITKDPTSVPDIETHPCAIPPEVKSISSGKLAESSSTTGQGKSSNSSKGKGKARARDDMDVDVDDDEEEEEDVAEGKEKEKATPASKGRVVAFAGTYVAVLESFKNIAPIMDAIAVDLDNSGQVQLVTCSGGANTGSLNIVRNGSEYKEQAFVQGLENVTGIWPVRMNYEDQQNTHLVISTLSETHLLRINDSGNNTKITLQREAPEDYGGSGFVTAKPTLAFANFKQRVSTGTGGGAKYIDSQVVVQVVPDAVYLLQWNMMLGTYVKEAEFSVDGDGGGGGGAADWGGPRKIEIVAASVNGSQVAVALRGGKVIVFCMDIDKIGLRKVTDYETGQEISAVSLMPVNTTLPYSKLVTVAYWQTNTIEIFNIMKDHKSSSTLSPPLPAVVRSLLLFNFGNDTSSKSEDYHVFLLAGLGDGSIATMMWKDNALHDLKIVSLGHAPVNLTPCEVDGKKAVFAAGNRSTLFSFDKNRLVNSPITLKEISAASRISTRSFTSSLVFATPSGLSIGFVRNTNKMHVRSLNFGLDNPRKVTHSPLLHAFGVACTSTQPARIGDLAPVTSSFHLVDDVSLSRLAKFTCEEDEEIASALAFTATVQDEERPFFCIGTLVYKQDEIEPSSGRLIVLSVTTTSNGTAKEFKTVATADVGGCVFALKNFGGQIVASVNSSISLWNFGEAATSSNNSPPLHTLKKVHEWNHSYIISSLGSLDDSIVAGDQISSVSLLSVEDSKFVTKARDYGPLYPLAVELVDESNVITSNDSLNIVLFKLEQAARAGASKLERMGVFHLGDMISKFFRGSLTETNSTITSELKTEMIFFTSSGRIGIIIDVQDSDLALHLSELQRNMSATLPAVGNASHTRWRAPKDTRGSTDAEGAAFGFIDGDFLELFAVLPQDVQKKIMKGKTDPEKLKMSENQILKTLEQLQGLH